MAKIRIKSLPKALSGLEIKMRPGLYGTNGNRQFSLPTQIDSQKYAEPEVKVGGVLGPVDRSVANLEAEKGETAVVNINGIPAHFTIGGKRHSEGGTPLNLPDNSFIFSDTAKMKIKNPMILAQFGMASKKGGYTPAEIAKKYDINKYRKILADKESDDLQKKTAEMMIANYNDKLAKLSLAQESIKGFPQGIPVIAMPYIIANDIDLAQFTPTQSQEEDPNADMGVSRFGGNIVSQLVTKQFGGVDKDYFSESSIEARRKKLPIKESYINKGFSGKKEKEEAFRSDPLNKPFYNVYKKAMEIPDSDPRKIKALSDAMSLLSNKDYSNNISYSPVIGGLQSLKSLFKDNKVNDFVQILGEEKLRLTNPQEYEKLYQPLETKKRNIEEIKNKNKELTDKTLSIYNYYRYILEAPNSSDEEKIEAAGKIKEYDDLNPYYRKRTAKSEDEGFRYEATAFSKNLVPSFYNEAERKKIDEDYTKVSKNWKKLGQTSEEETLTNVAPPPPMPYEEETVKPDTVIYKKDIRSIKQKDLDRLREERKAGRNITYKAYGGDLPKAKLGDLVEDQVDPLDAEANRRKQAGKGAGSSGTSEQPYTPAQAYDKIGVDNLNKLRKQFNLDPIPYGNPTDPVYQQKVKEAAGEMQAKASEQYPALVKDYMINKNITPTAALSNILGPRGYGKKVGNRYKLTAADLQKAIKEGNVTDDEILQGYQDKLWHYRGLTLDKKKLSKAEYEKKMKEASVDINGRRFFSDDPSSPYKYTEYEMEEIPENKKSIEPKEKETVDRGDVKRNTPTKLGQSTYAPWWLQDIIGTAGAYGDLARIKRYQPWQATPQVYLPEMVPYDPTRELAANAEQANIAMQAQQAFTGPQQLAAASAVTQGKALANTADIMARYNNLNVGLANQLEKERANLLNQASQQRAALDTQLWDKYTIANQQFDNSKALARQELRKNVINAVTNRAKTQAMNTLYPDYYTDPSTGGFVQFRPGYTPTPTTPSDNIDALWKKAKELNPNDPSSIFKVLYNKKDSDEETTLPYQGYPS